MAISPPPRNIRANLSELGQTGLRRTGGFIEGDEFLLQLANERKYRVFREMRENDPVIGAILFAIEMLLRQTPWHMEVDEKDTEGQKTADFVEECRKDMSSTWSDFMAECLSFLPFGWSYFEICYMKRQGEQRDPATPNSRYTDGKIGWRKFAPRAQESLFEWIMDNNGGLQGMVQMPAPSYQRFELPIEKSLLFRTTSHKGNPEGRSVLRSAYRPWFFKKHIEEIEAIGIERDLAGLPVAYVPPEILLGATSSDRAMLARMTEMVANIKVDEEMGIVFPRSYDENHNLLYELQLLSTGGTRQINTDSVIARYDQRIAMVVLADFILLGHEKVGSFALSSDKTDLFAVALGTWLDHIQEVMNRYAIPRLLLLNGMDPAKAPELVHGDIEMPNLEELSNYIQKLSGSGVPLFPNQNLMEYLHEVAHLPLPTEEEQAQREKQAELDQQLAQEAGQASIAEAGARQKDPTLALAKGPTKASPFTKKAAGEDDDTIWVPVNREELLAYGRRAGIDTGSL